MSDVARLFDVVFDVVLVDVAVSDFSSDIANNTLEQVPNALYQGKSSRKARRKAFQTSRQGAAADDSTDSEELDHSDSGYSSPMHRKNQTSSGTDALKPQRSDPPPSYTTTQAASLYHAAALHHEPGQLALLPQNSTSYASALASSHQPRRVSATAAARATDQMKNNLTSSTSNKSHTKLTAQLSNGAKRSDSVKTADDSEKLPGTKRKRRRGKRKRKRGKLWS